MIQRPRLANPSVVRQAPDNKAINHTTNLFVESQPLATPFEAQIYLEPGINVKLTHRRKPKTNFELPSDMPKFPLGFVPINLTPGANKEDTPIIKVKEEQPQDLLDMFAKISAQQLAESTAVEAAKAAGRMDVGTLIAEQYRAVMKDKNLEAKKEALLALDFTETEADAAISTVRLEEAVRKAREPAPPARVQEALAAAFPAKGVEMEVQTELSVEKGKELYARKGRATAEASLEKKVMKEEEKRQFKEAKAESKALAEAAVATAAREAVVGPRGRTLREIFASKKA